MGSSGLKYANVWRVDYISARFFLFLILSNFVATAFYAKIYMIFAKQFCLSIR
jgi:hypothetical protein